MARQKKEEKEGRRDDDKRRVCILFLCRTRACVRACIGPARMTHNNTCVCSAVGLSDGRSGIKVVGAARREARSRSEAAIDHSVTPERHRAAAVRQLATRPRGRLAYTHTRHTPALVVCNNSQYVAFRSRRRAPGALVCRLQTRPTTASTGTATTTTTRGEKDEEYAPNQHHVGRRRPQRRRLAEVGGRHQHAVQLGLRLLLLLLLLLPPPLLRRFRRRRRRRRRAIWRQLRTHRLFCRRARKR